MKWVCPDWPAPANVRAYSTTRQGGNSTGAYASMNLGDHVKDDHGIVQYNRRYLTQVLQLPSEPCWLFQTHSSVVVDIGVNQRPNQNADAALARRPGLVCVTLTADCLPILICNQQGTQVAAVHAGWRGLAGGIIENTVAALLQYGGYQPGQFLAWLGPAIGPAAFEVADDVRNAFIQFNQCAKTAFVPLTGNKWLANMYLLAQQCLNRLGIEQVHGGEFCTVTQYQQYYSYRRDGNTGRMASLIWLDSVPQAVVGFAR
ncbi:MAG: peptidoglycan editing factor PgeF [Gammaproteobacteria bacterium]|nr:peptidoglycan editing factor PgeF [Gammaproteobacteria bacterium]